MAGITYGYVRVSTQEQNEARQLMAMADFGVEKKDIVVEKLSGKDFNRPRYQHLVDHLQPNDVLVVKSIDRLRRNYDEILEQWAVITKKRQAEGISAAKARGVEFGRKPGELPDNFSMCAGLWLEGKISSRWAGQELGISYRTFQRRAKTFFDGV